MKKFLTCMIILAYVVSCFLGVPVLCANTKEEASSMITEQYQTYRDGDQYSGKLIASHMDVGEFADLIILDDGGSHIDGNGNKVFSNYVLFNINLNFNSSTKKIGNTDAKVSWDKCDWNDTAFAAQGDTEQYIAYGAISAVRTNGKGETFQYEPIFSKGNTFVEGLFFNVDGDYTINILFESVKNNKKQNHVLSWSFKIRSSVYVTDEETGFAIKNSGISAKTAILDYLGRQDVEVECKLSTPDGFTSNIYVYDGFRMEQNGTYRFTVRSNGFVSEVFDFTVDKENPSSKIFFANLRKQLGDFTYEAEDHFYLVWTESASNPISVTYDYYGYNSEKTVGNPYIAGMVLTEPGLYYITATMKTHVVEYLIQLTAGDAPAQNQENLTGLRFNNFKTKWYQVYNKKDDRFLCFDMSEYDLAYEAAMSIENETVNASSGVYFYNGKSYTSRIKLTAAMHDAAVENIKVVYYDPQDYTLSEESERVFSPNAFDGMVYLDDDFQFVTSHPSETQLVFAVNENGKVYRQIEYFVPIRDQAESIPDGKYTIIEADMYGNESTYTVYRDKSAPEITLCGASGVKANIAQNGSYSFIDGFLIQSFTDRFDAYAVLKITHPSGSVTYYYEEEYAGILFHEKGEYLVEAYDRNRNQITAVITVR